MIKGRISSSQIPMRDEDVARCQRVFEQVCEALHLRSDDARDELAAQIIHLYQSGIRDEETLKRLVI